MNKSELIDKIAKDAEISKVQAGNALNSAIEGVVLPSAARIAFPALLSGWTGFGPIGVAMTLMTWCGIVGVGWVVSACAGAVFWERHASTAVVVMAQTGGESPSAMWWQPRRLHAGRHKPR